MTDAELKGQIQTALREALTAVVDREREASDKHRVSEVKDERDARQRRERREAVLLRYVVAPLVVAAVGGGGLGVYQNMQTPEDVTKAIDSRVDELETAIKGCPAGDSCPKEDRAESLTGRVNKVEQKTQRLGNLHMGQRELVIDVRDELSQKLDAVSPRAAQVPEPESVKDAREQVKAYKTLKATKGIEEAMSKGDPFAGLDN